MDPDLLVEPGLLDTLYISGPLPFPDDPETMVIIPGVLLVAVHAHPAPALIVTERLFAPLLGTLGLLDGLNEYVHPPPVPAWVTWNG